MQRREFIEACAAVGTVGSANAAGEVSVHPETDNTAAIQAAIDAVGEGGWVRCDFQLVFTSCGNR